MSHRNPCSSCLQSAWSDPGSSRPPGPGLAPAPKPGQFPPETRQISLETGRNPRNISVKLLCGSEQIPPKTVETSQTPL